MTSCVVFATHTDRFVQLLKSMVEQQSPDEFGIPKGGLSDTAAAIQASFENTSRSLNKLEESFSYHMRLLIEALNYYSATETVQFLCLVVRLDYNQHHKSTNVTSRSKW